MTHPTDPSQNGAQRLFGQTGFTRIILLVVIAAAVIFGIAFLPLKQYVLAVLQWTDSLGFWGPFFLVIFYIVATVFFLPGSVITLGAGVLFGLGKGFIAVWIGSNLGAIAAFLIGRTLARDWISKKVEGNVRFAAIEEAIAREGLKIVLLLRLSPIFPFNFLNYALGLTKVGLKDYAIGSLIGMIPGTLMYVYIGAAAGSLAQVAAGEVEGGTPAQILKWVGLVVTIIVTVYVTSIARKSLRRAEADIQAKGLVEDAEVEPPPGEFEIDVKPEDEHNRNLVSNAHPPNWTNPSPAERYNLVVIGAGTAGLVTAAGAAGLGAKVALVERNLLGGDCLNVGCVPSKCIIASSRVYGEIMNADEYGVRVPPGTEVDFPAVMERMRKLRARISHNDSAERFKGLGVDVFLGHGRFLSPGIIEVGDGRLHYSKAVIATGARAVEPKIKGLADAGFLTNETVFSLTERPGRLAVIGGGPIGCELAQAFRRLGCEVTIFHRGAHILEREDADAAEIVQQQFISEGINLVLNSTLHEVEVVNGEKVVHFEVEGTCESVAVDEILVGAGRAPNVEGLNLPAVGVGYDKRKGVYVDDRLRTTGPNIFAAGDICMQYKFTHAADAAARIVIQNALFKGSKRLSALTVPWCTYTDPEIAHVGMYERDAAEKGIAIDTYVRELKHVDRAVADGQEEGFVKVHVKKGSDKILGATIVAAHAGDMISEITLAMVGNVGLGTIAGVIHPYPTQAEAVKQVGDAYNRTRLTPTLKWAFNKWLEWTR